MIGVLWDVLHSKTLTKTYMTKTSAELQNQPVPDLDLKIGGGGVSRPLKKGGAPVSKRFFSAHQASGCPKKRGAPPPGPSPGSAKVNYDLSKQDHSQPRSFSDFSSLCSNVNLQGEKLEVRVWVKIVDPDILCYPEILSSCSGENMSNKNISYSERFNS